MKFIASLCILMLFSRMSVAGDFDFEKESANGNAEAQFELGMRYMGSKRYGMGVTNWEKAYYWLGKAAEQGRPQAQFQFGRLHAMQKPGLKNVDLKMAAFWYLKAAEQNERNSAFQIANMYFSGEGGLPKDIDKAYYWMEKAAEQDNAYAQRALVEMYSKGKGDKQIDYYLAYIWLRVLAEGDHYWSMEDDELHWKLNEEVKQKQLLEFKKNLSSTQLTLAENKIDELKKIAEKNIHEQNRAEAAYECSIDKLSPEENQKCIEKIYSGMLESEKINKQLWGI